MKKILMEIYHNEKDSQVIIQGIKLFLSKNKGTYFILVGAEDDLLTIKDHKNVECVFLENDENKANVALKTCMELLVNRKDEISSFMTSASFSTLKEVMEASLPHEPYPCFVSIYSNAFTGRKTMIGDLGYDNDTSYDALVAHGSMLQQAAYKLLFLKEEKVNFLALSENISLNPKMIQDYLTTHQEVLGKIITPASLLECDCPILLSSSEIIRASMLGFYDGFQLYQSYLEKGMKDDFKYKMGGKMMKSLLRGIHSSIDSKFSAGGVLLLGYNLPIIKCNETTNANGILASITLAESAHKYKVY